MRSIRRALISVSDKDRLDVLAPGLHAAGVEILSTGGTARLLRDMGLPVTDVAAYTGFPEIMDGRVKTLHPRVHGGILGRDGDGDVMEQHGIDTDNEDTAALTSVALSMDELIPLTEEDVAADVRRAADAFRPDLVHSHHLWLLTALVREDARFLPYFRAATPIDVVERMAMGSRPASRGGAGGRGGAAFGAE